MNQKIWEILNEKEKDTIDILLENRGLKKPQDKDNFFKPEDPFKITLKELGISEAQVKKAIDRIKKAIDNKEKIMIYGDYDADGITASAIMWEAVNSLKADVLPYIPDRFIEGYGINPTSVQKLKQEYPNLKVIITVDNGIVAYEGIKKANELGIDVIVTDHHEPGEEKPKAFAIIHTTKIAGSGVSYITARELTKKSIGLELTAIGTIADQMPLLYANRSFAKHGIEELKKTKRVGLNELFKDAGVLKENLSTYEINYVLAPRINSMGRLSHGIESLRLLCTKDQKRAKELAKLISKTNIERQTIVEKTLIKVQKESATITDSIIFVSSKDYHEGIIGLAAGRIVEEFYRPAIVVSVGEKLSKGSARSIGGFNIIEAIRMQEKILVHHGGHTMAAGFTVETSNLEKLRLALNKHAKEILTEEILKRKLKIDTRLNFKEINWDLVNKLKQFEPTGQGNPTPTFVSEKVEVQVVKILGKEKNHLKLKLRSGDKFIDAIGFSLANNFPDLKKGDLIDVVYNLDVNEWNGVKSLQLKLKDLRTF